MKKLVAVLLILCLGLSVIGCSQDVRNNKTPDDTIPKEKEFLRIGTASMGGSFYTTGAALSQMVNDKMEGYSSSSQATGGSAENCRFLNAGELELALVQSSTLKEAISGTGAFKDGKIESLRAVGTVTMNEFHILAYKNSGIKAVEDLKGKRIGVGPMGGGIEVNCKLLLQEFGITDGDYKPIYGSTQEAYEAIKIGQIDAIVHATSMGTASTEDGMASGDLVLIPIEAEKQKEILQNHSEMGAALIPANTYSNQPENIVTVSTSTVFTTRADMGEDIIYNLTKTIYENNEYLKMQDALLYQATPENAIKGIPIEFHPGAQKYFEEINILK